MIYQMRIESHIDNKNKISHISRMNCGIIYYIPTLAKKFNIKT